MGAMRKAGVWLGLIEEEEDRSYSRNAYSENDNEFSDEEDTPVARTSSRTSSASASRVRRLERAGGEPATLRSVERSEARSASRTSTSPSVASLNRENLSVAPQQPTATARSLPQEDSKPNYRITTLHPTTYTEARTIGECYRDGTPVIMNLSEMDEADAKRLVDFAAGLIFGLRGSFERVTNRVFLLSPANVQVTAEDKAKIAEGGFFSSNG
ncbi:cell division protein SepF [Natronoglycomyces albus]|uniref:Cell division protein SepF n=1 Tax=Natronoglycomyces albus TaxID=2811108 RepID=A0A895XEJ6_9ACTN|nr:cell division protein SepF [Natronoglycomyces albus]QSB04251.1 cell division protein SepF [Natronoglycomyces albus]